MTRPARLAVALLALALAGCTGTSTPASTAPASTTTPAASPTTSTASPSIPASSPAASRSAPPTSPPVAYRNGRYPGYLKQVDAAGRTVTVDIVQFFTGAAAASAAAADGSSEVPPPNDYWIRNASKQLRTYPVAAGAPITTNVLTAPQTGSAVKNVTVTLPQLAALPYQDGLFWLTIRDGVVQRLQEQYLP